MQLFGSESEAADHVAKAHAKIGQPVDANGIRKLIVSLKALGLIDWIEPKAAEATPSELDAAARKVKT